MSRFAITGGTGFIGSAIVHQALAAGHEVAVIRRRSSDMGRLSDVRENLTEIVGDLHHPDEWAQGLLRFHPDAFIHSAWEGVLGRDRNGPMQAGNVATTVRTVAAAANAGCLAWVGLGSQAEYGPYNRTVDESDLLQPTTAYGRAKAEAYRGALAKAEEVGVRFAWLRVFSTYGPGDSLEWMIPSLIEKLLDRQTPPLTAGEQIWDYLYVDDAARAAVMAADSPLAHGAYNLGSGWATPLRETIEAVRDAIDPSLPLGFGEVPYRPDQVMVLHANVDRLKADTGWSPRIPLAEGMAKVVAWHKARRGST